MLQGCQSSATRGPVAAAPAARVNGQEISIERFRERLRAVGVRAEARGYDPADPAAGPARLEDEAVAQLIDETLIAQQSAAQHLSVSAAEVSREWSALAGRLGGEQRLSAYVARQGFTRAAYRDFLAARMREVALARALARGRAVDARAHILLGADFVQEALRASDDRATALARAELGWVGERDIAPTLWASVGDLNPQELTGVVATDQGFVVAQLLERQADRVRLRVIVTAAPILAYYDDDSRPQWFVDYLADLRHASQVNIFVGSRRHG